VAEISPRSMSRRIRTALSSHKLPRESGTPSTVPDART
jgi:hypothetical protein